MSEAQEAPPKTQEEAPKAEEEAPKATTDASEAPAAAAPPKDALKKSTSATSQRKLVKDLGISWKEANDHVVASQKELGPDASEEKVLAHAKGKAVSSYMARGRSSTRSKSSSRVSDKELARNNSIKTVEKGEKRISDSVKKPAKSTAATSEKKAKKSKSFKGIRGLLRGNKSKKKVDQEKGDDASTVYNVALDDRSTSAETAATEATNDVSKDYLLRLVVLLMDVESRRFELLQLEFDSDKAVVSDVLSQVPVSVTEETLRVQPYRGVVTSSGEEMTADKKLSDFCKGNEVLVALPKELESSEVTRLARPILSDPNVIDMLTASNIDASSWAKQSSDEGTDGEWKSRQIPAFGKADVKKFGNVLILAAVGCVVVAAIVNFLHVYISTPIQLGHVVSPGIVLSKCGLLKGWPIVGPSCSPAYLEVNAGIVSYYEGKNLSWVIHGHVCEKEELSAKTCVDGLEFLQDASLAVGSQPIKWLERHSEGQESDLTPWPFAEKPKIKSWNVAGISHGAKEAVGKIKDGATDAAIKIKDGTANAASKVKDGAVVAANKATDAALKVKDGAAIAAGKIKNGTVDTVGKIQHGAANIAGGAADKIKTATEKIKGAPQMFMKNKEGVAA